MNKLKHSNFQICISLNKTMPNDDEINLFKSSLEQCFSQTNFEKLVKHTKNDELNLDKIERCIIKHCVELAPEDNKLHSHSIVCITHRTHIKLDLDFIRETIKDLNNLTYIPYVHNKVTGGGEKAAIAAYLEYIEKD